MLTYYLVVFALRLLLLWNCTPKLASNPLKKTLVYEGDRRKKGGKFYSLALVGPVVDGGEPSCAY